MTDKEGNTGECKRCGHDQNDHYISDYGIYYECEVDDCDCTVYDGNGK